MSAVYVCNPDHEGGAQKEKEKDGKVALPIVSARLFGLGQGGTQLLKPRESEWRAVPG